MVNLDPASIITPSKRLTFGVLAVKAILIKKGPWFLYPEKVDLDIFGANPSLVCYTAEKRLCSRLILHPPGKWSNSPLPWLKCDGQMPGRMFLSDRYMTPLGTYAYQETIIFTETERELGKSPQLFILRCTLATQFCFRFL